MARFLTGLFGAKQTQPPATSLRVNTSLQGVPIALLLGGRNRLAGNLIDYYNFNYQGGSGGSGGGGKGGIFGGSSSGGKGASDSGYNYFVTFAMGICAGPVADCTTIWVSGTAMQAAFDVWPAQLDISTPSSSPGYTYVDNEVQPGE
jgi:hypothetical protein